MKLGALFVALSVVTWIGGSVTAAFLLGPLGASLWGDFLAFVLIEGSSVTLALAGIYRLFYRSMYDRRNR